MEKRDQLMRGPLKLYEQMKLKILELIRERQLKEHDLMPSEGELAELFGVSRRTSKEAMKILQNEQIVYRIPRRGTFLSDQAYEVMGNGTQTNIQKKSQLLFIVPEFDDFIGRIVTSAIKTAEEQNYELLIKVSNGDLKVEEEHIKQMIGERKVAGLMLFPGHRKICGNEVLRIHLAHFPLVLVDRVFREINLPSVFHDHFDGALKMTNYLIEKGHRKIGFISEPISRVMSREERYQGYIQAMIENKVTFNAKSIYIEFPEYNNKGMEKLSDSIKKVSDFLNENRELTAVFCSNDYVALSVFSAANELGLKVPEQLSVVGFTDFYVSRFFPVPLTTVRKSPEELGKNAVELLLKKVMNPEQEIKSIVLKTQLVERDSVLGSK